MSDGDRGLLGFDTSVPNPARMYDYFLGAKDHFPADEAAAEQLLATVPLTRVGARENRAFLQRAVGFLAGEAGIRQFLDIGTGLPTTASWPIPRRTGCSTSASRWRSCWWRCCTSSATRRTPPGSSRG